MRRLILDWPVVPEERTIVKRILNIADCRIGVYNGHLLAESPLDCTLILLNIDVPDDDWVVIYY